MLFNSFQFWIFFSIVIIFYVNSKHKTQNRILLIASYAFYSFWDYRFLSLIIVSTITDYIISNAIVKNRKNNKRKKQLLCISIIINLGMLAFFKYCNFFVYEFAALLDSFNLNPNIATLNIILPVGISFYTFQTMSYTIDVYRGTVKAEKNLLDFGLYVAFFPQLVAGPIERPGRLLPQIKNKRELDLNCFTEGLYHVLIGLFKKVIIADNMAPLVNSIFLSETSTLSGADVLIGIYAFSFQIYGDFSGYSSIAQGIAKWMGFDLMWNFKMPYLSANPSEFWNRWHISLSSWIRDYIYIPLGGNKRGTIITIRNLIVTMSLGGLWHGAARTFILWGLYHGLLLVLYRILKKYKIIDVSTQNPQFKNIFKIAGIIIFFHLTCIGWLFFRAESLEQVGIMISQVATNFYVTELSVYMLASILFFCGPLMVYEWFVYKKNELLLPLKINWRITSAIYTYMLVMLWVYTPLITQEFIYFQF